MRGKGIIKKLITSILVIVLMISGIELHAPLRAQALADEDISSNYLNATVKFLHLSKENETFNFNIKKAAQKKGAAYTWYINPDKGSPNAVTINKKTGLVTAKAAGIAYIGCKITLAGKKVAAPEAKVIVRNNITKVDIGSLPGSNTITAYHAVKLDYKVLNTEGGKDKKTQGITRFEITEDTTGAGSADENGLIFPTREGTLKIRVVSFQSTAKYKAWLADKKANAKYITASSEWYTMQVGPSKNSASVSTQTQLDIVLNNKDITDITLTTEDETVFIISKGDYSTKNLVVNTPNADVKNYGYFKNITINAIKDSTWIEYADGNVIYLSDKQLRIVAESGAHIKKIVFDTADTAANVEINGIIDEIVILVPTAVKISGTAKNVPVVVEEKAEGSAINSSVSLNMQLKADTDITLSTGAEESVLDKGNSKLDVNVDNQTSKEITITTNHTDGEIIKAGENTIPTAKPSVTPTAAPTATPTPTTAPEDIPAPADNTAPSINASNGAVLGTDFMTIRLTFSESIMNNLDSLSALKNNILMTSDNGTATTALGTQDNIKIQGNQLIITLSQALIKENVQIIIKANSLKDAAGNVVSTAITSNALVKKNDTIDTATPLTVNAGEQKFWIESENDCDIYSFKAQAGEAYNIDFTAHSSIDLVAAIIDKDENFIMDPIYPSYLKNSDPYYKMSFFFIAPATGTFYIAAGKGCYDFDTTGCYGINISTASVQTAEPDNTMEKASLLTAGADALTRYIYPANDEDWFKFEGKQVMTYTILTADLDYNMDTVMYLYNSKGELIAQNDNYIDKIKDMTHASKIDFTVTEAGTYYICIKSADTENQGKYDILLTSQETDVESYVKEAETAAAEDPEFALDAYEAAVPVVAAMAGSAAKTAFQTRLGNVYTIIENKFITDTNSTESFSGTFAYLMQRLGCISINELYEKEMDMGELFLKQNPVRNYTSISEIKAAFNATISQYNSLLSEVNSAADLTSMKQALNHLAEQYTLIVSDAFAQAVLNEKATASFTYISKIFVLDSLKQVTFGATLKTVSGSAITYTPLDSVISATMDGVPVSNGQFVEAGKNVTFTVVPDSGYEVALWTIIGDFNNTGVGGAVLPHDNYYITNNVITFNNLHSPAGVHVEIVKSPSINLPEEFSFSKSSLQDLVFTAQTTNTVITGITNYDTQEDIMASGYCSITGDSVTIKKEYLCGLSTGDHILEFHYVNSYSTMNRIVHITD